LEFTSWFLVFGDGFGSAPPHINTCNRRAKRSKIANKTSGKVANNAVTDATATKSPTKVATWPPTCQVFVGTDVPDPDQTALVQNYTEGVYQAMAADSKRNDVFRAAMLAAPSGKWLEIGCGAQLCLTRLALARCDIDIRAIECAPIAFGLAKILWRSLPLVQRERLTLELLHSSDMKDEDKLEIQVVLSEIIGNIASQEGIVVVLLPLVVFILSHICFAYVFRVLHLLLLLLLSSHVWFVLQIGAPMILRPFQNAGICHIPRYAATFAAPCSFAKIMQHVDRHSSVYDTSTFTLCTSNLMLSMVTKNWEAAEFFDFQTGVYSPQMQRLHFHVNVTGTMDCIGLFIWVGFDGLRTGRASFKATGYPYNSTCKLPCHGTPSFSSLIGDSSVASNWWNVIVKLPTPIEVTEGDELEVKSDFQYDRRSKKTNQLAPSYYFSVNGQKCGISYEEFGQDYNYRP